MKIAILCSSSLDTFQQAVLAPIMSDARLTVTAAIIDCRPKPSLKQRFKKNLQRGRGGYMLIMFIKSLAAKHSPTIPAKDYFSNAYIPTIETKAPYSSETVSQIQKLGVDVMVMLGGFGIVKEPILSIAPMGILSYHHGDMRKYRGQPIGFWELYNGEQEMGVTVQRLATGIDRGTPIVEKAVAIHRDDTVATLRERALSTSIDMMHNALLTIQQSNFHPEAIESYGQIYTIPNLRQYIHLQIKLFFRK